MNKTLPDIPVHTYHLALPVSAALVEKLDKIRRELYEKNKITLRQPSPSAILLASFEGYESAEKRWAERLQQIANGVQPFTVQCKNYSAVETHTIHVHIPDKSSFGQLFKALRPLHTLFKAAGTEPVWIKEPQLIVAENLKPFQFISMWMDCEHSVFTGRFAADGMVLSKQVENGWEEIQRFSFLGKRQTVRQGDLFNPF
jgi:hypothetical protein